MDTEAIIIILVALLAAGTLLAGRAGIRSIQRARTVVFYRTRRTHMLAGWQWLALALLLLSGTVASAFFGESLASQILSQSVTPATFTASPAEPEPTLTPAATRTSLPSPTSRQTQTADSGQTPTEPAVFASPRSPTLTPSLTRTLPPTATPTITRTPIPSLTPDLSALATRAARTLQAQLATAALSHTPTRTRTSTPTASLIPTFTPTFSPTSTPTRTPVLTATPSRTRTPRPSQTPRPIVTLTDAHVVDLQRKQGVEPQPGTPEELGAFMKSEMQTWGRVVKEAGIKVE